MKNKIAIICVMWGFHASALYAQYVIDSLRQALVGADKPRQVQLYQSLVRQYGIKGEKENMAVANEKLRTLATELGDVEAQYVAQFFQSRLAAMNGQGEQAARLMAEVEQYAEASQKPTILSMVYRNKSNISYRQGKPDESIAFANKALVLPNQRPENVANTLIFMSIVYESRGEVQKALDCLNRSYEYVKQQSDPGTFIMFYNQMGSLHANMKQLDKSRQYFEETRRIALRTKNKSAEADAYNNLAAVYMRESKYAEALEYLVKARDTDRQIGRVDNMHNNLTNLGLVYTELGKYDLALQTLNEAKDMSQKLRNYESLVAINNNIALLHIKQEQFVEAVEILKDNEKLCRSLNRRLELLDIYKNLAFCYQKMERLVPTYEAYDQLLALSDSLYNERNTSQINEFQTKYETAKKEQEIALLAKNNRIKDLEYGSLLMEKNNQAQVARIRDFEQNAQIKQLKISELEQANQNIQKARRIDRLAKDNQAKDFEIEKKKIEVQRQYALLAGVLALTLGAIALGYVLYRQNKLRLQNRAMALEQKMLRSQMNPHFIFNSLTTIQNYLFEHEPQKTALYLSRFAKLMRQILESSREDFIPLEKEIQTLQNYLELQKMRFGERLQYHIDLAPDIDPEEILIPPMFAQPFIENSLEHGISHLAEAGLVEVRFTRQDQVIVLEVKDNGVGMHKAQTLRSEIKKEYKSLATQITQERLALLRQRYRLPLEMVIEELKTQLNEVAGTQVRVQLPYHA